MNAQILNELLPKADAGDVLAQEELAFAYIDHDEDNAKSASFLKGFMLQFVNVKIYMFGITALTGYIVGYNSSFAVLLFFEIVIATIGTIATSTWIGMGVLIQKYYLKHYRIINVILALTLLEPVHTNIASINIEK